MVFLEEVKNITFFMALVDFIPVILFMVGMSFIIRIAYKRVSTVGFSLITGGALTSFLAGLGKCTWKFIYACGLDFQPLTVSFVIYQTVGFLLIAIGLIELVKKNSGEFKDIKGIKTNKLNVSMFMVLIALFIDVIVVNKPSFIWYIIMGLFTGVYLGCLAIICFKVKKPLYGISFIASFILVLAMAGLGSKFDTGGSFEKLNWIAQVVNSLAQFLMAFPCYKLFKLIGSKE